MAVLQFQDFTFEEQKDEIKVHFLKLYYFSIKRIELERIGKVTIETNRIIFKETTQEKAEKAFFHILNKSFNELKNKITKHPTLYVHKNSGIPLIGSLSFGIVDKGTDMLELKPLTSCNIDCIFCSVDEGLSTRKQTDIVVEKDYLVEETKKLLEYKQQPVHIYINPHGEPLLYADIVELVRDLAKLPNVTTVSIITNGTLLTEPLAAQLIEAGLTGLNVSLNSFEPAKAKEIAGTPSYEIDKITKVLSKIKDKIKIIITPVYMQDVNSTDIENLIKYCKENNFELLIQNFCYNKRGRKPVKAIEFESFYTHLKELEKKYNVNLIKQGKITQTKELPKPFLTEDMIPAEIIAPGRYPDESIAAAKNRTIILQEPFTKRKKIKVKITRDQHNIFYGKTI